MEHQPQPPGLSNGKARRNWDDVQNCSLASVARAPLLGCELLPGVVQLGSDVRQAGVLVCQLSRQHLQPLCKHLLGILQLPDLPASQTSII